VPHPTQLDHYITKLCGQIARNKPMWKPSPTYKILASALWWIQYQKNLNCADEKQTNHIRKLTQVRISWAEPTCALGRTFIPVL
jgi:hypothetical protein